MEKPIPKRQNTESRKKLIETAKQLFYDQGYHATTLAQLSEQSGINNGLITYYFGSKNNLASIIHTAFMLELRNEIAKQLYTINKNYQLELAIAMETRILIAIKFQNENLMRFLNEYAKEKDHFGMPNEKREHYYQLQKRLINPEISDIDLKLYEVCGISIMNSLSEAYASNYYRCDSNYLADYAIRLLFTMLQLPVYQIEALVDESGFLEDRIRIRIDPYFKINPDPVH